MGTYDPLRPNDGEDALEAIRQFSFDKRAKATADADMDTGEKLRRIYDKTQDPFARQIAESGLKVTQEAARKPDAS